ncbi:MAG: 3-phosphoshikimate 1-carboxyvinyltransferase [Candidatus Omnitrophica bacterium]|nr:3-phosphoshikimate 1-carboxyvinyltransferase [Candidatus Omnitrophota bacterium]MDE2222484.1 3-phosphoshikimate 1-carboxyvinyltransferase [Candidatus Omnitrophota bacterium]
MILNCLPVQRLSGTVRLPASKSYSIRAHIIAARGGKSRIKHASDCDDALAASETAAALKAFSMSKSRVFSVGESGTTLRFLLPLLPFHTTQAVVKGKGTLVGRPNAHLCASLRGQGMDIRGVGPKESVPIVFNGGSLRGGRVAIDGSLSSQFISSLLIALPALPNDSQVVLTGRELVSQDYIQMTIQILARAGIVIKRVSAREYRIKGGQRFKGLKDFVVPSDYGLAAFPMAAAVLLPSQVSLLGNFQDNLIQSDGHILEFLKAMGADFTKTTRAIKIKGPFDLKGGTFSLKDCPDLVPVMAVLALFAEGQTRLVGIRHARAKESDRISDLRAELLKVGARVIETSDSLTVKPRPRYRSGQLLDSHHDHRLAMAFTVLGLKIGCRVAGIESCRKSYPSFINDMKALGALS